VFHWVELRTFCHATEERERVEHALRFASGGGEIQASPTEGQHGNPILILVTRLEDRKAIAAFWDRATSKEHALAWRKNLEDRVDHGVTFHVRFDKQAAYEETAREDAEICERMTEGRRALHLQGRSEIGPYQSPMEDGMLHFHEFLRRELAQHASPQSI